MSEVDDGVAVGALDAGASATVLPSGAIRLLDGSVVDWWILAEDRVHHPADEPTRRQRRIDGTPVVETMVRVPGGDVTATAYAVADLDGLVVIDIVNVSPGAVAVAFDRAVLSDRTLHRPPPGAGLPADAVIVPVGHAASARIAVGDERTVAAATRLLSTVASSAQVARGWLAQADVGPRLQLPDSSWPEVLVAARCDALLASLPDPVHDPTGFVLGVHARRGHHRPTDVVRSEIAGATERIAKAHRRTRHILPWDAAAALERAALLFDDDGDRRARTDVSQTIDRLPPPGPLPSWSERPHDAARLVAWCEERLVRSSRDGIAIVAAFDVTWLGQPIEAHDVLTRHGSVSFAIRWHGERPALLWETSDHVRLTCPDLDPSWTSVERSGDALLDVPVIAAASASASTRRLA